jgi:hypothetical protein
MSDKWSVLESVLNSEIMHGIVTCRPIARERLGKQARNKYSTKNRVDPFLGNARNNRTGVARSVFCVGSHISIARQRIFSMLASDPRLYNEKPTIIDSW